eukprot:9574307-Prorocentrum_lima.AAC.1
MFSASLPSHVLQCTCGGRSQLEWLFPPKQNMTDLPMSLVSSKLRCKESSSSVASLIWLRPPPRASSMSSQERTAASTWPLCSPSQLHPSAQ